MTHLSLWKVSELQKITGGKLISNIKIIEKDIFITGVSTDSRDISDGDMFVAIDGERDGHDYVVDAFFSGAELALVSKIPAGYKNEASLLIVENVLEALNNIAKIARKRFTGLVIAITGSVGKTSTKEMLKSALEPFGEVHASPKSFNNYLGVPISLVTIPKDADFAVLEIGMNSPGEIEPLSRLVEPDHIVITTTGKSHTENFDNMHQIAKEKASIVKGMAGSGKIFLSTEGQLQDDIMKILTDEQCSVVKFGTKCQAKFEIVHLQQNKSGTILKLKVPDGSHLYFKLSVQGIHYMYNAVGVIAILFELGFDVSRGMLSLSKWSPLHGRGFNYIIDVNNNVAKKFIEIIDDAYNSNPISLRASLQNLANYENPQLFGKRKIEKIAILGDMLELGSRSKEEHKSISNEEYVRKIDKFHCVGKDMKNLYDNVSARQQGEWFERTEDLILDLKPILKNADIILVKASNSFRFSAVVDEIKSFGKVVNLK